MSSCFKNRWQISLKNPESIKYYDPFILVYGSPLVSHGLLIAAALVLSHGSAYGICGGESDNGTPSLE